MDSLLKTSMASWYRLQTLKYARLYFMEEGELCLSNCRCGANTKSRTVPMVCKIDELFRLRCFVFCTQTYFNVKKHELKPPFILLFVQLCCVPNTTNCVEIKSFEYPPSAPIHRRGIYFARHAYYFSNTFLHVTIILFHVY